MIRSYLCTSAVVLLVCFACATSGNAQLALEPFQYDPVLYFAGPVAQKWVGNVRFMLTNYSDTLRVMPDSAGRSLLVSRVLVNEDDTVVVSRGEGLVIHRPGDSTYRVRWLEYGYDEATGVMRWGDEQWEISFEGEWKQWVINLRREGGSSFTAGLARAVGRFPPVELAGMTYQLVKSERPFRKPK